MNLFINGQQLILLAIFLYKFAVEYLIDIVAN